MDKNCDHWTIKVELIVKTRWYNGEWLGGSGQVQLRLHCSWQDQGKNRAGREHSFQCWKKQDTDRTVIPVLKSSHPPKRKWGSQYWPRKMKLPILPQKHCPIFPCPISLFPFLKPLSIPTPALLSILSTSDMLNTILKPGIGFSK